MFGLSINKILFTVLLIVAVWRGFKLLEQFRAQRIERQDAEPKPRPKPEPPPRARAEVELAACPDCGTFGPRGSACSNCQRSRHGG